MDRHRVERRGKAGLGKATHGFMANEIIESWLCTAVHGAAWRGIAWFSAEIIISGKRIRQGLAALGAAMLGSARNGAVRRGKVRHGFRWSGYERTNLERS